MHSVKSCVGGSVALGASVAPRSVVWCPFSEPASSRARGFCRQGGCWRARVVVMVERDDSEPGADARRTVAGWFDRHVDTIHRYVARRAGEEVARDVTAETFRVAMEQFDRFDSARGNERAWLYGIATNLLHRHWRTEQRMLRTHLRSRENNVITIPGDPLLAVDARLDAEREIERVLSAIGRLDPDDRDLIVLIAWEQLSSVEIAEALEIPASTIRARLRRIRSNLRVEQGAPT